MGRVVPTQGVVMRQAGQDSQDRSGAAADAAAGAAARDPARKGEFLAEHWFFNTRARGGFILYQRPQFRGNQRTGVKRCLRIEALGPGPDAQAEKMNITLELDRAGLQKLAHLVTGREPREMRISLERPGRPAKKLTIYR